MVEIVILTRITSQYIKLIESNNSQMVKTCSPGVSEYEAKSNICMEFLGSFPESKITFWNVSNDLVPGVYDSYANV